MLQIFPLFFQTEEDANLAPQMGDGGFRFDPNAGGASGPQDPGSMQGTPFQFWFWFIKNSKKNQKSEMIHDKAKIRSAMKFYAKTFHRKTTEKTKITFTL